MKKLHRIATGALAALMAAGLAGCAGADDGTVNLTFQIWDVAQRDGMQAMCDAYTAQESQMWTSRSRSPAGASTGPSWRPPPMSNQHARHLLDAHQPDPEVRRLRHAGRRDRSVRRHDPELGALLATSPSPTPRARDGRVCTACPRTRTPSAWCTTRRCSTPPGSPTPTRTGPGTTWCEASQKIYDATGKYGYMAYGDDQLGYWNFVYQKGGYILTEDKTRGDFDNPATQDGHEVLHRPAEQRLVPRPELLRRDRSRHRLLLRAGRHVPGGQLEHPVRDEELPRHGRASGTWRCCPSAPTLSAATAGPPSPTA